MRLVRTDALRVVPTWSHLSGRLGRGDRGCRRSFRAPLALLLPLLLCGGCDPLLALSLVGVWAAKVPQATHCEPGGEKRVFTVEQRDALRERVLRLAGEDDRVVAGAVVGSLAVPGGGDRFSDLDLTFGIAAHVPIIEVLDDWATTLADELSAVTLADLERGLTIYRIFLLPGALQLDLSMTPAAQFRPYGPRLRLVFGEVAADGPGAPTPGSLFIDTPVGADDIFGWGVIYALHTRACIERGRLWQAEHYVGAVRDHALSLACLRHGVIAVQARGYDDLPAEARARFQGTLVGALEPGPLRVALAASVKALIREGAGARVSSADIVAERLVELC
jgi:hypothetical protein